MTKCHGCGELLEPLAAIRQYHGGCDPKGRVEYLETLLTRMLASNEMSNGWKSEIQAALDSKPVLEAAAAAAALMRDDQTGS